MALNPNSLADLIKSKHIANNPTFAGLSAAEQNAIRDSLYLSIAQAVVAHFKGHAVVAFTAGKITGNDVPSGDTHSTLVAVNGKIT
jgi:hypothetical protein